jgi:hypothetical protein
MPCAGEFYSGIEPHETIASGGALLTIFGSFDNASAHSCRFTDVRNALNTMAGRSLFASTCILISQHASLTSIQRCAVAARYASSNQLTCKLPTWTHPETVASVSIWNSNTSTMLGTQPEGHVSFLNIRGSLSAYACNITSVVGHMRTRT